MTARVARWGVSLVLLLLAALALFPILFMLFGSFKTPLEFLAHPLALPRNWGNFDNFIALQSRFQVPRILANTVVYVVSALAGCLLIAVPASYALAKLDFPGSRLMFGLVVASMGIPVIAVLIPDFLLFVHIGLTDSPLAVVLMWITRALPGTIFLITALLRSLPDELIEAAKLDGAGYLRLMRSIVLPLSVPALVTATIFNVTAWWNDLLVPIVFLQTDEHQTITGSVATIGSRLAASNYPLSLAALLLSSVAPILLGLFLQGYIRRGLVLGASR